MILFIRFQIKSSFSSNFCMGAVKENVLHAELEAWAHALLESRKEN